MEKRLEREIERMEAVEENFLHYKIDGEWYTVNFWSPREGVLMYRVWIPCTGWSRPFVSVRRFQPDEKEIQLVLYSLGEPVSAPKL